MKAPKPLHIAGTRESASGLFEQLGRQPTRDDCGRIFQDYIRAKPPATIADTVQTGLHYFFSTDSFESCLIATISQGGDADTTGALAGMLAGLL